MQVKRIAKWGYNYCFNAGQKYCRMLQGKGSILQYFRPSISYHLSLRSLFCLFLSGRFTHVLLHRKITIFLIFLSNKSEYDQEMPQLHCRPTQVILRKTRNTNSHITSRRQSKATSREMTAKLEKDTKCCTSKQGSSTKPPQTMEATTTEPPL